MKPAWTTVVTTAIDDLAMQGFGSIFNCQCLCDALNRQNHPASLVVIHSQADLLGLADDPADIIMAGIKFLVFGKKRVSKAAPDKVWLAEFLSLRHKPFAGSNHLAIQKDFDKQQAKQSLRRHGLATADFFVATPGSLAAWMAAHGQAMPFPLFVKPLYESDSRGVDDASIVNDYPQLERKVRSIDRQFSQPALIETYLPGREFTVALLEDQPGGELLDCPLELVSLHGHHGNHLLGFQEKKENRELMTPIADPGIRKAVSDLARQSFRALGGRDFGRIDIKMDAAGLPHFLEANLLPGMNPQHSYYPEAFRLVRDIGYDELTERMLRPALERLQASRQPAGDHTDV
jgi:D-alanine-D-alanine ligase